MRNSDYENIITRFNLFELDSYWYLTYVIKSDFIIFIFVTSFTSFTLFTSFILLLYVNLVNRAINSDDKFYRNLSDTV